MVSNRKMHEEKIRTFIAIELEPKIQEECGRLQERFKAVAPEVKWVAPRNIHLTLKFLGNVDSIRIEEIKKQIVDIAKRNQPFEITIAHLGAFPKPEYPRVIWVGVDKGKDKLIEINQALEEALTQLGFPKEERPFHPHLTLGRVKFLKDKKGLAQSINSLDFKAQNKMVAKSITLMKSTLTPKGPIYTPLSQAKLG